VARWKTSFNAWLIARGRGWMFHIYGGIRREATSGSDSKTNIRTQLAVTLETLEYDLTVFKVHIGNLTLKAYTKGERVLRFEAIVHNTRDLGCGRLVARFPIIVGRLQEMLERFLTTLDCVDVAFISDHMLDQPPLPARLGKTRVGGLDLTSCAFGRSWPPCWRSQRHSRASASVI
jgi:hypothetical protein